MPTPAPLQHSQDMDNHTVRHSPHGSRVGVDLRYSEVRRLLKNMPSAVIDCTSCGSSKIQRIIEQSTASTEEKEQGVMGQAGMRIPTSYGPPYHDQRSGSTVLGHRLGVSLPSRTPRTSGQRTQSCPATSEDASSTFSHRCNSGFTAIAADRARVCSCYNKQCIKL